MQADDFALATWSVMNELLKAKGVLDRSAIVDLLDRAAKPMERATDATTKAGGAIIRRFSESVFPANSAHAPGSPSKH
jgi:hypothetical protein